MRLPLVLGILAVATTPVWFLPDRSNVSATVAAVTTFDRKPGAVPEQTGSLRVVTWDEASKSAKIMEVARQNGQWVIPSHFDFPADGNTRVTKAAAGFLGVERGTPRTDDPKRHVELGVVDPLDATKITDGGQGRRVTLKDLTGAVLADVIVGKYVDGASGLYYVRDADDNKVYTAKVDNDLSTKFIDYVEPDPFKLTKDDVRAVAIADYSVDEAKGTVEERSSTAFAREAAGKDWSTAKVPDGKRINKTAVDNLLTEVSGLRLAGVRPYAKEWLQARGFYLTQQGLYGNEGSIAVTSKDGLKYWLFFGEIAPEDEADKTAERKKDDSSKDGKAKDAKPTGSNRYLAVFVQYDAAKDEVAKAEADKKDEKKDDAKKDEKKPLSGKERATKAQERFQKFFYVISDESFKKLRPSLDQLFENKPAEPMAGKSGKTNAQWLADHAKQDGVKTTASGLQYEVLTAGPADGVSPTDSDQVEVKYKGTLVDGEEFDSTKGDATATFGVTGVIKGWTEALKLMKPGDAWKVTIPSELAYGEAGSPPKIGANAILQFEMTLVKVVK